MESLGLRASCLGTVCHTGILLHFRISLYHLCKRCRRNPDSTDHTFSTLSIESVDYGPGFRRRSRCNCILTRLAFSGKPATGFARFFPGYNRLLDIPTMACFNWWTHCAVNGLLAWGGGLNSDDSDDCLNSDDSDNSDVTVIRITVMTVIISGLQLQAR